MLIYFSSLCRIDYFHQCNGRPPGRKDKRKEDRSKAPGAIYQTLEFKRGMVNVKKTRQRLLASLLTGAMMLSMCGGALAAGPETETGLKDLEETPIAVDYKQSAQIPLEGWYQETLKSGRQVQMYFSEYAACRAYFTVVAIPDGVTDPRHGRKHRAM